MDRFDVDTIVTRVTPGKEADLFPLQELEVGDEFTYDGKRYSLTTKRVRFNECEDGSRVRRGRFWYIVHRHGRENVLFPLVPYDDPFSTKWGTNHGDFPYPRDMVDHLTFEEMVREAVLS